jgi:hypothetical protein
MHRRTPSRRTRPSRPSASTATSTPARRHRGDGHAAEELTPLAREALAVLQRHPGAALPLEELVRRLRAEGCDPPASEESLLAELSQALPVIVPARRRWVGHVPRAWILAPLAEDLQPFTCPEGGSRQGGDRGMGRGSVGHPLLRRLRGTMARVGRQVLPCSSRDMARWERYVLEEAEVHRALARRLRARQRSRRCSPEKGKPSPPPGGEGPPGR